MADSLSLERPCHINAIDRRAPAFGFILVDAITASACFDHTDAKDHV